MDNFKDFLPVHKMLNQLEDLNLNENVQTSAERLNSNNWCQPESQALKKSLSLASNNKKQSIFSLSNNSDNILNNCQLPTTALTASNKINGSSLITNTLSQLDISESKQNFQLSELNFMDSSISRTAKISRVLIVQCSSYDTILKIITRTKSENITCTKLINIGDYKVLAIGWFDMRNISSDVELLKKSYHEVGYKDIIFNYVADDMTFKSLIGMHDFRFLEDSYDSIYVCFDFSSITFDLNLIKFQNSLYLHLTKFGDIYKMDLIPQCVFCYRCRFYDIRVPFELKKIHTAKFGGIKARLCSTLIEAYELSSAYNWQNNFNNTDIQPSDNVAKTAYPFTSSIFNEHYSSFSKHKYFEPLPHPELSEEEWRKYQQLKHRRLASLPFTICNIPQENMIDLSKIISGEDMRTTVLVRNIPNKISHKELKEFVDNTSYGDYDFLYLRIDFENRCNVGYAFISFDSSEKIIPFYRTRHDKKWNKFSSEKVCQLAYAKVQGKDNLIQKFRNSKVMEHDPEYRPKIYCTQGQFKGQELEFPTSG